MFFLSSHMMFYSSNISLWISCMSIYGSHILTLQEGRWFTDRLVCVTCVGHVPKASGVMYEHIVESDGLLTHQHMAASSQSQDGKQTVVHLAGFHSNDGNSRDRSHDAPNTGRPRPHPWERETSSCTHMMYTGCTSECECMCSSV